MWPARACGGLRSCAARAAWHWGSSLPCRTPWLWNSLFEEPVRRLCPRWALQLSQWSLLLQSCGVPCGGHVGGSHAVRASIWKRCWRRWTACPSERCRWRRWQAPPADCPRLGVADDGTMAPCADCAWSINLCAWGCVSFYGVRRKLWWSTGLRAWGALCGMGACLWAPPTRSSARRRRKPPVQCEALSVVALQCEAA